MALPTASYAFAQSIEAKTKFSMKKPKKHKLYWHIHHGVLLEIATEPIANRIKFIKQEKRSVEVPTRLKCLKPVKRPHLLPKPLMEAARRLGESESAAAYVVFFDLVKANFNEVMARHRKEYPKCTCDQQGRLIFPGYGYAQ